MLEFLPKNVKQGLSYLNLKEVYEIRLRTDKPIRVNYRGVYVYLGELGVTECEQKAIKSSFSDIADCVYRAGKYSVYSVEEQIKQGFLTAANGERIGLAGEYVFEKGQPLALRNFTSICIRVPHAVLGCGQEIYQRCMRDRIRNLLLMSPPGLGKTTILRDLCEIISEKTRKNILVCDERGEISAGLLGNTCDVMKFSDKATAFDAGIRAMRPDVIITDELSEKDCYALEKAVKAGVIVLASAHFADISYIKPPFLGIFDRFVLLRKNCVGEIENIYNANGEVIP